MGWVTADATNQMELQSGIFLFEAGILTLELPNQYVSPFPAASGFLWDVAGPPNPNQGHSIMKLGYTNSGAIIGTWGMLGVMTWAAMAKYCKPSAGGGAYFLLTPDQIAKGAAKAPNGVAWVDLVTDFDHAFGGSVPIPVVPTPTPPPGVPVSLAMAQAWVRAGINKGLSLQTRSQAGNAGAAALAANWPKS